MILSTHPWALLSPLTISVCVSLAQAQAQAQGGCKRTTALTVYPTGSTLRDFREITIWTNGWPRLVGRHPGRNLDETLGSAQWDERLPRRLPSHSFLQPAQLFGFPFVVHIIAEPAVKVHRGNGEDERRGREGDYTTSHPCAGGSFAKESAWRAPEKEGESMRERESGCSGPSFLNIGELVGSPSSFMQSCKSPSISASRHAAGIRTL
ncbi:hypothetical protein BDP67DRAFT_117535 [Colletotrichum lupini]|nr:hypothetical protein BDP67DRAFT_117535 [Colletotrichum lupini]